MKNFLHPVVYQNIKFDKKLLDSNALNVIQVICKAGFEAYLVGGCVRDLLLDLKPKDFDVATSAKPEQVRKLFKRARLIGRRFRLVHVLFSRQFVEVATFRKGQILSANSGITVRDNVYGNMKEDVVRRDFSINALYYDINKHRVIDYVNGLKDLSERKIRVIGEPKLRFAQDPVRMIRMVRFQVKLGSQLNEQIQRTLSHQAGLLANIPPARLYEECLKLFHNEYAFAVYQQLEKYSLLKHLFAQTTSNEFIKQALLNTSERIKQNQSITPAFIFAVFLWQAWNEHLIKIKKQQKPTNIAEIEAANFVISVQIKQVFMPKWLILRIKEIWLMQSKLEAAHPPTKVELLQHPRFRMAYDFLVLRAKSIDLQLSTAAEFWHKAQRIQNKRMKK